MEPQNTTIHPTLLNGIRKIYGENTVAAKASISVGTAVAVLSLSAKESEISIPDQGGSLHSFCIKYIGKLSQKKDLTPLLDHELIVDMHIIMYRTKIHLIVFYADTKAEAADARKAMDAEHVKKRFTRKHLTEMPQNSIGLTEPEWNKANKIYLALSCLPEKCPESMVMYDDDINENSPPGKKTFLMQCKVNENVIKMEYQNQIAIINYFSAAQVEKLLDKSYVREIYFSTEKLDHPFTIEFEFNQVRRRSDSSSSDEDKRESKRQRKDKV